MADRGDPRGPVDVDPDVALVRDQGLAGVEADPDADGAIREPGLRVAGGRQGVGSPSERDEEGVALGVDLYAVVPLEGVAQHAPVLGERLRVGVAELVHQPRRALDVGEEEGDGAGRELAHPPIIRRSGRGGK
jgi:hypothetical protein